MMIIYLLIVFCFLMLFLSIYTLRRLDKHFIKIVDEGIYYVDTNNRVYSIAYDNAINEISEFLIENNDSLPNILIIHHIGDTPIASYMADYYKTRGIDIRLEIVSSSFDVIKYKLLAESVSNSDHVLLILSEQSCNSTKFLEIASYVQMYGRNKGNKRFVICMKIYNGTCPDLAGNIVVQGYRLICLKELFVSSIEVFRKLFSTKPVELIQAMIENGNANYQKAYELGQAALLKRKYIAESYFQLGISYSYLGQYEKAYVSYQKAALLKNDLNDSCQNNINHNWAKCFNTGVFCLNYNDTNNALQYFRDSTCANPMMIKGWINLGYLYYKLDNDNPSYKEELSSVIDKLLLLVDDNAEDRVITLEFIFQVLIDKDDNERVQKVFASIHSLMC